MGAIEKLFLNRGQEEKTVVEAPAFSITKVMAVVAPLFTVLVTLVTSRLKDVTFSSSQITILLVALIAFLALTGSADVVARGMATSADKNASGRTRWIRFDPPLKGTLDLNGRDEEVDVVAASDSSPPEYLCLRVDKKLSWEPGKKVKLG